MFCLQVFQGGTCYFANAASGSCSYVSEIEVCG
jgi:hypothetical protein